MIKMAILGAGTIAIRMSKTIVKMEDVETYAIAAREYDRAAIFAKEYGFKKAYGSYEELLKDDEVNLVYIATPHSHHYQHVKMCLEHNKNVLCEKPFTVNAEQAEELINMAEKKGLLLSEAMWTRYMPSRKMINDIIASGAIGEVTTLEANLGYNISHVKRMVTPELASGALLDLGIYMVHFASMIFGIDVKEIVSTARMTETGVDGFDSITMNFTNGKMAVMYCNMQAVLNRRATIFGTKGFLEIQNVNNPEKLTTYDENYDEVAVYYPPNQISGYEYEVLACKDAIEKGKLECEAIPHAEILRVMKIMDQIRSQWGYEIPVNY